MRLMEIIWSRSPIRSGELVTLAYSELGWKKSTVYTVIKKLSVKGAIKSENSIITPLITKADVLEKRSGEIISNSYSGSLPMFLTAFLNRERLTRDEAEALKKLIDEYTDAEEK